MKISDFLEIIRKDLAKDYSELRNMSHDGLLYVLEDTIIPSVKIKNKIAQIIKIQKNYRFYDIISQNVVGRSGPLFNLQKKTEQINDTTIEYEINLVNLNS